MFKVLWENIAVAILAALFGAILSLVVTGEHIGEVTFWINAIFVWVIFVIFDLVKGKHKKEAE
jgi:hypothetical protein